MPFRLLVVSILLLAGIGASPRPLAAQFDNPANGQPEAARRFAATQNDSHNAPKPITPRTHNASDQGR